MELNQTLKRLKRSQLDTFYFHGVTQNVKYEMHIDKMIDLKKSGRTINIGLSTNQLLNDIPPSIDTLQIPYSNLSYYADRADCDIEVHSIIRRQKKDERNIKEILKDISRCAKVKRIILGTTNISHFFEIAGMINDVE
jgi:aryl-alcohol dehydrogenase-like predicted oxidoreductase